MKRPGVANFGLLAAMMEPPPTLEAEFQDWYDTEHFPERAAIKGFLTANRFVCLDGFPKYLALYDLSDLDVMRGPGYRAVAVDRYSVWTKRIISQVWGQYRAEASQIYPGRALLGGKGGPGRVVMWRFRRAPRSARSQIVKGLRAIFEPQPETAQVRVFEAKQPDGTDYLGIIDLHAPFAPAPGAVAIFKDALKYLDLVNVYTTYSRRMPGVFPKGTDR
jgi:hypothetical protein